MQIPKFGIVLVLVVVFGILEDDSSNSEFTPNAVPPQRGAKPAQERNEINGRGSPPAGRMPFISDSTSSRRSATQDEPAQLSYPQRIAKRL
jgi:hypothetical protein